MTLNNFFSSLKKNKITIIFVIILIFSMFYFFSGKVTEGYTSCSNFKSCDTCVNGKLSNSSSSCYWNKSRGQCGSWFDTGYSRTCDSDNCPVCPTCPKLTRLKNPTYITEQ
jgi:hypothetical protein